MQRPITLTLVITVAMLAAAPSAFTQEQAREAMQTQEDSLQTSIDVQRRINALDDETREMLNDYRQTMTQVRDLTAYNDQLGKLVATQRVELAEDLLIGPVLSAPPRQELDDVASLVARIGRLAVGRRHCARADVDRGKQPVPQVFGIRIKQRQRAITRQGTG